MSLKQEDTQSFKQRGGSLNRGSITGDAWRFRIFQPFLSQRSGLEEQMDICVLRVHTHECAYIHPPSGKDVLRLCPLSGPGDRELQQLH